MAVIRFYLPRIFRKQIPEIMSRSQGKVDSASKFISSLLDIVNICKSEMTLEGSEYHEINSEPQQWNVLLNGVKNKGIASIFGKKVNEDGVEILQNKLTEAVSAFSARRALALTI